MQSRMRGFFGQVESVQVTEQPKSKLGRLVKTFQNFFEY